MAFINVFVANKANISIKNNNLVLSGEKTMSYPLEDLNSIMCESQHCNISSYTLSTLASHNILLYFCNDVHLPCALLLPYNNFYKPLEVTTRQLQVSKPLQKQLWQFIIKNKINNQAFVLSKTNKALSEKLHQLSAQVLSGDTSHVEGYASAIYFKGLFGSEFSREHDNIINICLNYGYAIVRGLVARSICAHGLLPFFGIFHCNQLNQFNLADDLIEPFRAIVDLFVLENIQQIVACNELTTELKLKIYNLVNFNVLLNNEHQPLYYAIDVYVSKFVNSINKNTNCLTEISIIDLEQHSFE